MNKISRENAKHYTWKEVCDGWHFAAHDDFSVIVEKMPPHTAEDMHYHCKARQFFYILSGRAVMYFHDRKEVLDMNEGIEIPPGEAHQMRNDSDQQTEFLVISVPKAYGDKIIV